MDDIIFKNNSHFPNPMWGQKQRKTSWTYLIFRCFIKIHKDIYRAK